MTASLPAKVMFLANLNKAGTGDKVRFLGCIEYYDTATGTLTLSHKYGSSSHLAKVTIEHVREDLPTSSTEIGTWVNVTGYILRTSPGHTSVQAIMLWEAGPLKIGDYEKALQARVDISSTG